MGGQLGKLVKAAGLAATALLVGSGCARNTRSLQPVTGFDAARYMGTWYEIARFPHSFERGLTSVTAEYSLQDDGSVRVVNRGYSAAKGKWQQAEARAVFAGDRTQGSLRVTFFKPFSAAYKVIRLEPEYRHAVVASGTYKYLWILARSPDMDRETYDSLVDFAASQGFDTSRLERITHGDAP